MSQRNRVGEEQAAAEVQVGGAFDHFITEEGHELTNVEVQAVADRNAELDQGLFQGHTGKVLIPLAVGRRAIDRAVRQVLGI